MTVTREVWREPPGSRARRSWNRALHLTLSLFMLACLLTACHRAPKTAEEVLDRSIAAHGGAALTGWKTMTVRGRIQMQDGITYNAAYLLFAEAPDKLRVEHDMTRDRGRLFYEYFMNGSATWSRSNLVVGTGNAKQLRRWFFQLMGAAQARSGGASGLALEPNAVVAWPDASRGGGAREPTGAHSAYVVSYRRDGELFQLYIDTDSYLLVQETWPGGRRLYADFKRFGGVTFPTRVLEITKGRQGDARDPHHLRVGRLQPADRQLAVHRRHAGGQP